MGGRETAKRRSSGLFWRRIRGVFAPRKRITARAHGNDVIPRGNVTSVLRAPRDTNEAQPRVWRCGCDARASICMCTRCARVDTMRAHRYACGRNVCNAIAIFSLFVIRFSVSFVLLRLRDVKPKAILVHEEMVLRPSCDRPMKRGSIDRECVSEASFFRLENSFGIHQADSENWDRGIYIGCFWNEMGSKKVMGDMIIRDVFLMVFLIIPFNVSNLLSIFCLLSSSHDAIHTFHNLYNLIIPITSSWIFFEFFLVFSSEKIHLALNPCQ